MILPAQNIRAAVEAGTLVIEPFCERAVQSGMSYGLGPAGVDIRIAQDVTLWPGDFVLASAIERLEIPNDLMVEIADKSSWIRRGITVGNSKGEPGWKGFLTLEIKNNNSMIGPIKPIHIKAGDPIAHLIFHRLEAPTDRPYSGKYQSQKNEPVPAIVEV